MPGVFDHILQKSDLGLVVSIANGTAHAIAHLKKELDDMTAHEPCRAYKYSNEVLEETEVAESSRTNLKLRSQQKLHSRELPVRR